MGVYIRVPLTSELQQNAPPLHLGPPFIRIHIGLPSYIRDPLTSEPPLHQSLHQNPHQNAPLHQGPPFIRSTIQIPSYIRFSLTSESPFTSVSTLESLFTSEPASESPSECTLSSGSSFYQNPHQIPILHQGPLYIRVFIRVPIRVLPCIRVLL